MWHAFHTANLENFHNGHTIGSVLFDLTAMERRCPSLAWHGSSTEPELLWSLWAGSAELWRLWWQACRALQNCPASCKHSANPLPASYRPGAVCPAEYVEYPRLFYTLALCITGSAEHPAIVRAWYLHPRECKIRCFIAVPTSNDVGTAM